MSGENDLYEDGLVAEFFECGKLTPKDIVNMTKQHRGFVDWDYMSQLYGVPVPQLREEWGGVHVWQDPMIYALHKSDEEGWLFEEQYFNNKVRKLLREAEEMNEIYPGRFEKNIQEIKKRMPEKVKLTKEAVKFGVNYISVDTYNMILRKFFDLPGHVEIMWKDYTGKLHLDEEFIKSSVKNKHTYGTPGRTAGELMNKMLMGEELKKNDNVYDPLTNKKKLILNEEETIAEKEKGKLIQDNFERIIFGDPDIFNRVEAELNDTFDYLNFQYDGSYLHVPEANLRQNQKNLLSRILLSKAVLGAHKVGSGKNYIIPIACHLKKKRNSKEKNLVILGENLEGTVELHRKFYPEDSILVIRPPKDFNPQNRVETIRKMKEEDYVAIYMAASSYDMMGISRKSDFERSEREIKKARAGLLSVWGDYRQARALSKHIQKLEKEYCKLLEQYYDPTLCCFDSLGVTTLIVDECQNYKNIHFSESVSGVPGSHNNWSKKADSNYKKARYTLEHGGSVVYLTGVPMKNSPTDFYALLSTLMPEELEKCGIRGLRQWIHTFGERNTENALDRTAEKMIKQEIYTGFCNRKIFEALRSYAADFYFEAIEGENLPEFDGYIDIVRERSPEQAEYILECAERAEAVSNKLVPPEKDNYLKITTDGHKCALDIRLVRKDLIGKVDDGRFIDVADMMKHFYDLHPGMSQIGYLDSNTPKKGFNLYDEIKKALMERGIPEEEIAYIHEGTNSLKRSKLLDDLNSGKIRIMLGSTQKLGVGVNVQEHLVALHHIDTPWDPAGVIQREGRIKRHNNKNKKIFIVRYITTNTFDAHKWQILERKVRFFSTLSIGLSSEAEREAGLSARMVLDCAEIKALSIGSPLLKERMEKQNEIEELKISNFHRKRELAKLKELIRELPEQITKKEEFIQSVSADIEHYKMHKKTIGMEDRNAFGEELLEALKENVMCTEVRVFDWYQGFQIMLPAHMTQEKAYVMLCRDGGGTYFIKMDGDKALGCSRRLDYVLEHLPQRKDKHEQDYEQLVKDYESAKADYNYGNLYEEELEKAKKELAQLDELLEAA